MFKLPRYREPNFNTPFFMAAPDVITAEVKQTGVAPSGYHSTSMYPEYFKIDGEWRLIENTRMDCVPVIKKDGQIEAKEFRRLKIGDRVILGRTEDGREGIYLYTEGFSAGDTKGDIFAFRSGRSRETSFSNDYLRLAQLLQHDREHGHIVWVLGPAAVFDDESRKVMEFMVENRYCHAVFGGNAVATHDIEGALFHTALGQDLTTTENKPNGHYHHLDAINLIRRLGSVEEAVKQGYITNGLVHSCVKNKVPMVLAGSIRDDGPLPQVESNAVEVQDTMRVHTNKATTIVCLATQLHTIATGNLTPSYVVCNGEIRPVFIYAVDVSEFVLNKITDRGTLEVTTIVSNIQDFLFKLRKIMERDEYGYTRSNKEKSAPL
ncbi:hypothetical protein [Sinanaerobacter sp. ZZT-01]|uniref:ornithine cyclodeaminase family domain n=1 Tax=Sinanaerobacter sp. ZZT-01 TaxID=3111540 RepID=UPI002D771DB8|nr:hypothetical protein [Sinanaerobacter sp. ZZT-01]WRR94619.1 hypothetical protein U5921_05770 [Sinanaerobacter sp. ZZT-01]